MTHSLTSTDISKKISDLRNTLANVIKNFQETGSINVKELSQEVENLKMIIEQAGKHAEFKTALEELKIDFDAFGELLTVRYAALNQELSGLARQKHGIKSYLRNTPIETYPGALDDV
ncbi:hypothetical protein [Candidatus Nucleicultrix amoebiphila]|jgi:predicted HAD superfamily Cof-like phosphohydrolase|uniref:Uncharacterized protein n=1 Tax=Candidatus Nucleicultrix amoebiphila FS5 TaxID=1414854 RepID=A0A1W6N3Q9_9PROT|nr:hypothetical protein [Candidatus Nucleicultrix amoebiphila]ARN84401.1 hypothetical protein GQ61_02635 [Candidatus Nucleicultrix amoebiphila FS5]